MWNMLSEDIVLVTGTVLKGAKIVMEDKYLWH